MLTLHQATKKRDRSKPPAVALAVAGGGPVGAVYELGALRALEESIQGLRLNELNVYVGVSSGAFIAASLANGISCSEQCKVFMGLEYATVRFLPQSFLRPAYGEFLRRAASVPTILAEALMDALLHPGDASVSELMNELGKTLPSGIFDNEAINDFLQHSFETAGCGNRFEDLNCDLFVVAVDLDTGAAVRFSREENRHVPISRAVQASAALPGLYPPVKIDGRYYVDGALRRTLHASVALDRGVDLLLGINPLVPYAASGTRRPHIEARALIHGGLPLILSQTFRAMIQSRMKVGFERYRTSHPAADLVLLEPDRDDEEIFFTNIFSYASRTALCEHAFQCTRRDLLARARELEPVLADYGMSLNMARLRDRRRTLHSSLTHGIDGHASVGRTLAATLDELEDLLN